MLSLTSMLFFFIQLLWCFTLHKWRHFGKRHFSLLARDEHLQFWGIFGRQKTTNDLSQGSTRAMLNFVQTTWKKKQYTIDFGFKMQKQDGDVPSCLQKFISQITLVHGNVWTKSFDAKAELFGHRDSRCWCSPFKWWQTNVLIAVWKVSWSESLVCDLNIYWFRRRRLKQLAVVSLLVPLVRVYPKQQDILCRSPSPSRPRGYSQINHTMKLLKENSSQFKILPSRMLKFILTNFRRLHQQQLSLLFRLINQQFFVAP